ncbi:MAG: LPS export ABC transporter permease LptG [Desulfomonilaceae bacterium]
MVTFNVKIIERYIIVEFLKVFAICVSGFVMMLLLIDITDKIKYYFQYNPPGSLMLKYFLVKLPGYLFFGIPLGILLAGMLSLLMMARHSELIAMQANGIDALYIAKPVLMVGVAASLIMFLANETVIPWSNRYSEYIQNVEIAGKADTTYFKKDQIWIRTSDSIIHVENFHKSDQSLEKVTVIHWNPRYEFTERLYADKARWWHDHWMLYGVNRTVRSSDGKVVVETLPSLELALSKTPEDFQRVEVATREMNISQLGQYIDKLVQEGQSPQRYLVDWHAKIAFPVVCLIMAALSVPFAVKANPRGGGLGIGLGISLVIAFGYWVVHTMFISLGHAGYIPPVAAAWGANIIFGLAAGIMLLQAGT